jgi:hypothetical protein
VAAVVLVMVAGLTVFMSGQQGVVRNDLGVPILRNGPQEPPEIPGVVDDWSHHHLIFSNPGTEEEAIKNGRHDAWLRIVNDPRYIMQQLKRHSLAQGPAADYVARMNELARAQNAAGGADVAEVQLQDSDPLVKDRGPSSPRKSKIQRDWSMNMGGAGASLTGTVNNIGSGYISGSSTLVINGTTIGASAPTTEEVALTVGTTFPPNGSYLSIVEAGTTVEYIFEDSSTVAAAGSDATHTCQVRAYVHGGGDTADTVASHLYSALVTAGTGNTSTYTCNSDVTASNLTNLATITNPGGTSASFTIIANTTGSTGFGAAATSGSPFTQTGAAYTYTAGADGTQSGTLFPYWSGNNYLTPTQVAANIVSTILANGTLSGTFNAASNGANVIVSDKTVNSGNGLTATAGSFTGFAWGNSGTFAGGSAAVASDMGAGVYPAKYSATTTPTCSDYVAYNTGLAGSSTAPSIIAYNNIYSGASPGCGTTGVPKVYWEYNTGGQIVTSPVTSWDGTQLAFIQTVVGTPTSAYLVVLRYGTTGATISTPTSVSPSNYHLCPGPCMTSIELSGGATDTYSSPFYNYATDTLYVGDDSGNLHEFTPVFYGTPSEVLTCGSQPCWPVTLNSGNKLTSPVYDSVSNLVFVSNLGSAGGYLYSIAGTGTPTVTTSPQLANSPGIYDAALVDSTSEKVYVFVGTDTETNNGISCKWAAGCEGVFQFAAGTSLSGAKPAESVFGVSSANPIYMGTFDNQYYTSSGDSAGNLYVCAYGSGSWPKLVDATIASGAFTGTSSFTNPVGGTGILAANIANNMTGSNNALCSPVTEIYNANASTPTDWIFLSVTANGALTACSGACLYSWNTTSTLPAQSGTTVDQATQGLAAPGGTSGIIIDNISTQAGASQIYYGLLSTSAACGGNGTGQGVGAGGCAVQAAQSGL